MAPVAGAIFVGIADTEAASALDQVLRERAQELDPGTRTRLQSAALVPHMVYNRAMKARALLRSQFLDALSKVDVLVSATYPYPPTPLPRRRCALPCHRGRPIAFLLPPRVHSLLRTGSHACDLTTGRIYGQRSSHWYPAWYPPIWRGTPTSSGLCVRTRNTLA